MADSVAWAAALGNAWARTDQIVSMVHHEALLARPLPGQRPLLFHVGHGAAWARARLAPWWPGSSPEPLFDDLFLHGREDDLGTSARDKPSAWPRIETVDGYRDGVRGTLLDLARVHDGAPDGGTPGVARALQEVLEHALLQHEAMLALVVHLEGPLKRPVSGRPALSFSTAAAPRRVLVPAGEVPRTSAPGPWATERAPSPGVVRHGPFRIESVPVMNGELLEFVEGGAYDDESFWTPEGWAWRRSTGQRHPRGWRRAGRDWLLQGLFEDLPMTRVFDWPASVGWHEAMAYARWRGARLPTEDEWLAACRGLGEAPWPWGEATPGPRHGNFDLSCWAPRPVGSHPEGASALGLQEPLGNGWEWTQDRCAAPGADASPEAWRPDGEGQWVVLRGGSWATSSRLFRTSFRRLVPPDDTAPFTKFRLVHEA